MLLRVKEAIVVEGRYDKNTLMQIFDTTIIETGGFAVFKNDQLISLLRDIARRRGLIVLTDGDGAGFMIRGHIKGALAGENVKHAYIPDVYGKERRKAAPSREGKLGVEGMDRATIVEALRRAGATIEGESVGRSREISKADMYAMGLSGTPGSAERRAWLVKKLKLPERISANALLDCINSLYSCEELLQIMSTIEAK